MLQLEKHKLIARRAGLASGESLNYSEDLNAIHEVEMLLTPEEMWLYSANLLELTVATKEYNRITAPAWMKVEALAQTFLGKDT
jgi:hypothetical protein